MITGIVLNRKSNRKAGRYTVGRGLPLSLHKTALKRSFPPERDCLDSIALSSEKSTMEPLVFIKTATEDIHGRGKVLLIQNIGQAKLVSAQSGGGIKAFRGAAITVSPSISKLFNSQITKSSASTMGSLAMM
jgi:hypothetical protein